MAKADAFRSRHFARLKDNDEGGEVFKCDLCKEVFSKKAAAAEGKEEKKVGRLDLDLS